MRLYAWALPLAAAAIAFLGSSPRYTPAAAIGYADSHWRWAEGTGRPGPVVDAQRVLVRRQVPGPGWFQPNFECAEFVGRSLHAGGVPVPVVPQSNPAWPNLVNVDRLAYWLLTRGWAVPTTPGRLQPGDIVMFRYPRSGQSASPNVWQHMALVVHRHPLLLDAHNRARYHIPLSSLAQPAYQVRALHILRHRAIRTSAIGKPFPPGAPVQVAWRDLWTSSRTHLYWGQFYRVHSATPRSLSLSGVSGVLPPQAVVRVAPTPEVPARGQNRIVLGTTRRGRALISTPDSPIPGWTGHYHRSQSRRAAPGWITVKPRAVETVRSLAIQPLPEMCPLPADWAPRGAVMVMDAEAQGLWAQVLWAGSPTGFGFIPLTDLRPAPGLTVKTTRQRVAILLATGQRTTLEPGHLWIPVGCQTYYSGVLRPLASCPKTGT